MDDLISRQEAIDALEAKKDKSAKGDMGCFYNTIIQNDIDVLMKLPPAQPKRKKAVWIQTGMGSQCSNCWYKCETTGTPQICPSCGAEMK